MDRFDCASFISDIALAITKLPCGLFCATRDHQSLDGDAYKLQQLANEIDLMCIGSEETRKWIEEVNETIHQVDQLWQQETRSGSSSSCSCFLCGGDACSHSQRNLHENTKKLIAQGETIKVEHIDDIPNYKDDSTTAERNMRRVLQMLHGDDDWCVIGVSGPGGVGKTTLAKALSDKLQSDFRFSLVRLVELDKNARDDDVTKAVAKILDLEVEEGIQGYIHNVLRNERFIFILDNVWSESIQLSSIGFPTGQKGSKIIFTTRSDSVCTKIGAKEIKMECLSKEEAWQLFAEKAGEVVNDEEIQPLAKQVSEECGGLPLGLVIVGWAMKGRTQINEWNTALRKLQGSIPKEGDVELELYNHLKLSYDSLDDTLKSCFLYCSLYPSDFPLEINELVQCWIAENLIDEQLYYFETYDKGLSLVRKLMESCLLEHDDVGVSNNEVRMVKMHDTVRDVARWIAKSIGKSAVFSGYGISRNPLVTLSDEVENLGWISFIDNKEIVLPKDVTILPKATTLVLDGQSIHDVEALTEFLNGFRELRVLNTWALRSFPTSLLLLKQLQTLLLRGCSGLEEVPSAESLKILDLSSSELEKLPRGTEKFTNLTVLDLSNTDISHAIDADVIRKLNFLEVLDMSNSTYKWPMRKKSCEKKDTATLQDLLPLHWLKEVYLQLYDADGTYEECRWMERLRSFNFSYGRSATKDKHAKSIHVETDDGKEVGCFILHADVLRMTTPHYPNRMFTTKLETSSTTTPEYNSVEWNLKELYLHIRNEDSKTFFEVANALGVTFPELRSLEIEGSVKAVFCSDDQHIQLPKLEKLKLRQVCGTEAFWCGPTEIQAIAPSLRILELHQSGSLVSVCSCESKEEEWQSLEILEVIDCPNLKNLPNMPSIKEIRGTLTWWTQVWWDSKKIGLSMNRRFKWL